MLYRPLVRTHPIFDLSHVSTLSLFSIPVSSTSSLRLPIRLSLTGCPPSRGHHPDVVELSWLHWLGFRPVFALFSFYYQFARLDSPPRASFWPLIADKFPLNYYAYSRYSRYIPPRASFWSLMPLFPLNSYVYSLQPPAIFFGGISPKLRALTDAPSTGLPRCPLHFSCFLPSVPCGDLVSNFISPPGTFKFLLAPRFSLTPGLRFSRNCPLYPVQI